jgi:hypothetical protein
MTKAREPASIEHAILKSLSVLGSEAAGIAGKSEQYLRMCSDPDDERQISVKVALKLDIATRLRGEGAPIAEAYGALLEQVPSGRAGKCPQLAFMQIAAELGPLAGSITDALADGLIDLSEEREILALGHEVMDRLRALMEAVRASRKSATHPKAA